MPFLRWALLLRNSKMPCGCCRNIVLDHDLAKFLDYQAQFAALVGPKAFETSRIEVIHDPRREGHHLDR